MKRRRWSGLWGLFVGDAARRVVGCGEGLLWTVGSAGIWFDATS